MFLESKSAFDEISNWQVATWPRQADQWRAVFWLQMENALKFCAKNCRNSDVCDKNGCALDIFCINVGFWFDEQPADLNVTMIRWEIERSSQPAEDSQSSNHSWLHECVRMFVLSIHKFNMLMLKLESYRRSLALILAFDSTSNWQIWMYPLPAHTCSGVLSLQPKYVGLCNLQNTQESSVQMKNRGRGSHSTSFAFTSAFDSTSNRESSSWPCSEEMCSAVFSLLTLP
jgi:hypothetical protein